ncbi:phosphoethanolamine transferase [Candidatus Williamhamiltonella defendens]|uniref:phosphoethanolamine transferase n=1 Tax=Candidatus Williamhamiltonella defendens TaxID=138072 RepID=UPI000D602888|nr:phosphoethanolamine transferase [Candidatus Hamiltonella defensa]AWK17117.1 hypothetical protein CCS40_09415 [Candidatus Hamiltonella defensa]
MTINNIIKKINLKFNKIFFSFISLVILFFTAKLILKCAGILPSERNIFLLLILIVILTSSKKAFWFLVFPMCTLYSIYSPIGIIYGPPNYSYVASVFATDFLEIKEFLTHIPIKNYFYPIFIISGIFLYRFFIVKNNIEFYKNKTLISIFVIFSMINQSPAEFFKITIRSILEVKNEIVVLNNFKSSSEWGRSHLENSKYDNYILVIGESARKDYHHAFGYPINNTPFMSSNNGILVNGLTSGGSNTVSSLRLMLTKPDFKNWKPNYHLTLIDLVKSADIKTYWLSNQGYFGYHDTPISAIAKKSDYKYFLKYGDFYSKNTSDFLLLDKIKEIIKKSKEKKFIVVHLYGSHSHACDRVIDYKKIANVRDKKYSYINCYISSINKTDEFLHKLNSFMMKEFSKNQGSYSMLYFADHGLAHNETDGVIYLNNSRVSKFHYDIPLFETSSDSSSRKECYSFKSGLNFIDGIAKWIGIKNEKINKNYSFFDCKDDPNDYGLRNYIAKTTDYTDPAIDISGK